MPRHVEYTALSYLATTLVVVAGIILLAGIAWSAWAYYHYVISVHDGWAKHTMLGFAIHLSVSVLFVLALLLPWWRFGPIARGIGITVFLLSGMFTTWDSLWAARHGGRILGLLFVITAFAAHSFWLFYTFHSRPHDA